MIEQSLKGIDHLRYIQSASQSNGLVVITVTFEVGTDPDIAQVQVQNKLSQATASLPAEVQMEGLVVAKAVINFLDGGGVCIGRWPHVRRADLCDFAVSTVQGPYKPPPRSRRRSTFRHSICHAYLA